MTRVTSASSERVTRVRALHSRTGRRKAGRFVVEGPQAVRSALAAGAVVHDLFVDDSTGSDFSPECRAAEAAGARVTEVTPRVMASMAETQQPQGLLAVCALLPSGDLDAAMAADGPVLVLEAVADPGNVGTAIRTADAAGAAAVVLTPDCADIHNGKVVRSTAGSLFHLPVLAGHPISDVATAAIRAGRTVAVATGDGDTDLFDATDRGVIDDRTCWIVGSEAHGASDEARSVAGVAVSIPMRGRAESLNAAVAAAIVLFVTRHARRGLVGDERRMRD
ncbi:MAG: RNA methyltransferase [Actinomycetota bacterium]|nr:RNA methyltransferase [Actinomycetota bacterium]